MSRPTWARVDLDAVRANVRTLCAVADGAEVMAVVKADGYGHGAIPVARAALAAGATRLGVALVDEGVALREAGIEAPILLLSEPASHAMGVVVARSLDPTVCTPAGLDALAAVVGSTARVAVHVKIDTGMHRMGCAPDAVVALATAVAQTPGITLAGVWTHLAVADEPDSDGTDRQLAVFDRAIAALHAAGLRWSCTHAANSAGAIAHPAARRDLVRCGIALYGIAPAPALIGAVELHAALSLHSQVSAIRDIAAGEHVSYGWRWTAPRATRIATVPIGYADGLPRRLGAAGGEVLIAGRRCAIAGTVTMDQILVDVGDLLVEIGTPVVLLGTQGSETIDADEWAERVGTIAYEIVCGIGPRVPRRYVP